MINHYAWLELNEHFRADDDGLAVSQIHELALERLWGLFETGHSDEVGDPSGKAPPPSGDNASVNVAGSMPVALISTGGRYPSNVARYCVADIRATLQVVDGKILIRVDDLRNIDRWEELAGNVREVLAELRKHGGDDAAKQ